MLKPLAAIALLAGAPTSERLVEGDAFVDVVLDGAPARLHVDPGAPGLPLVGAAFAERHGLRCKGFFCFGVAYGVGRQVVYGHTAVARLGFGGAKPGKRRVGWMSRDYAMDADGTIGPAGLPEPVIRFVLGRPRAGERTVALPLAGGGLFGDWQDSRALLTVNGVRILVRFDPGHARSLATAAAAAAVARAHDGTLGDEHGTQEIGFGIERPYRVMTLARPLPVGPLALAAIGVRVTDGGGANTIPEAGADPSEVVVTAKGKKSPIMLSLGADALARCSALVFDKPGKQVRLTCA